MLVAAHCLDRDALVAASAAACLTGPAATDPPVKEQRPAPPA